MATVVHRWMTLSADGRPVMIEVYADNTFHLVVPPETPVGQFRTIPIDECSEGLYDRHGTLIVSREP